MAIRGLSAITYDFGVQIARGTVRELIKTTAGVTALSGAIVTLIQTTRQFDSVIKRNQIAFGGYANTLKTLNALSTQVASGIGFSTDDLMDGMRSLNQAGINAKDNMDLVAKAATATGNSFADVAKVISHGDFNALADMGIITNRTAQSMQAFGFNTYQASKQVANLLREASKKKLFENSFQTLDQIMERFSQFKKDFVQAIVGDPKDPNGLAFNVKKYMNKIADFFQRHRNTIIYYGKAIGASLLFVIRVVGDFAKRVKNFIFGVDTLANKSTQTLQDKIMGFQLWLEIQRNRIRRFFDEYGGIIWNFVKVLAGAKVISMISGFVSNLFKGVRVLRAFLLYKNPISQMMKSFQFKHGMRGEGFFENMKLAANDWMPKLVRGALQVSGAIGGGILGANIGQKIAEGMDMGPIATMLTETVTTSIGTALGGALAGKFAEKMFSEGLIKSLSSFGVYGAIGAALLWGLDYAWEEHLKNQKKHTEDLGLMRARDFETYWAGIKNKPGLNKEAERKKFYASHDIGSYETQKASNLTKLPTPTVPVPTGPIRTDGTFQQGGFTWTGDIIIQGDTKNPEVIKEVVKAGIKEAIRKEETIR